MEEQSQGTLQETINFKRYTVVHTHCGPKVLGQIFFKSKADKEDILFFSK